MLANTNSNAEAYIEQINKINSGDIHADETHVQLKGLQRATRPTVGYEINRKQQYRWGST